MTPNDAFSYPLSCPPASSPCIAMRHSPSPPSPPADVPGTILALHELAAHRARDADVALPLSLAASATLVLCAVLCLLSWGALAAQNERIRAAYELEERSHELLERGKRRPKSASRGW